MEASQDSMRLVKYFLSQYSLEGLWVGRSGPLRKQVIKITYQNDTLIGTKVYGDQVVPSGEVIFQVRVSPESKRPDPIDVQHVTDPRLKRLERFTGEGRVVDKKRGSVKWVESQLILVGDYFAFAWIPLGIQVRISPPLSPEARHLVERLAHARYSRYLFTLAAGLLHEATREDCRQTGESGGGASSAESYRSDGQWAR